MFKVHESWEEVAAIGGASALFNRSGIQRYSFFEIPVNSEIFHVNVGTAKSHREEQRYVFSKLETVFELLGDEEPENFQIYVQLFNRELKQYVVTRIDFVTLEEYEEDVIVYTWHLSGATKPQFHHAVLGELIRSSLVWEDAHLSKDQTFGPFRS